MFLSLHESWAIFICTTHDRIQCFCHYMRVVPSSFVPHMIGPAPVYNGQSPTFSCSIRAKSNIRLFLSVVIDIKKGFGSDWSHLFIKMFVCFLKGQKLPLRILEKMIWEFTLVLLQTLMEFHQATQLMKKVDTMSIKHARCAFTPVFPSCCASQMHEACTPYMTFFLSFAEMKRLLALSHERKFPSKWTKHICRGELCSLGYHKAPVTNRWGSHYSNFKWK